MFYFDHQSHSFNNEDLIKDAIIESLNYTTHSSHIAALDCQKKIFETRSLLKKFINAPESSEVIFTSGLTMALNMALMCNVKDGDLVISTVYEHNSVLRALDILQKNKNIIYELIDFRQDKSLWLSQIENIEQKYNKKTALVVINAASNVNGYRHDLKAISDFCISKNCISVLDTGAILGTVPFDLEYTPFDLTAVSGHKGLQAMSGIGALILSARMSDMPPFLGGGTMSGSFKSQAYLPLPERLEAGSLNYVGINALRASLSYKLSHLPEQILSLQEKYLYLQKKLHNLKNKEFFKFYDEQKYTENDFEQIKDILYKYTLSSAFEPAQFYKDLNSYKLACPIFAFNYSDCDSVYVAGILDELFNIQLRAGIHCAPYFHKQHHTQKQGMVRISFSYESSYESIDYLIDCLENLHMIILN